MGKELRIIKQIEHQVNDLYNKYTPPEQPGEIGSEYKDALLDVKIILSKEKEKLKETN